MDEDKLDSLKAYRIENVPNSMSYIANFITKDEEHHILNSIPSNKWITLSNRRLQPIPARLTATNTLVSATGLPDWLRNPLVDRISNYGIFRDAPHGINHCLVNEYLPGQGIMPHEDGAAYYPVVATVSLGGSTVLNVTEKSHSGDLGAEAARRSWRILQEPRSLLLTTSAAYKDTLHGIEEVTEDLDLNEDTVANWNLLGDGAAIIADGGRSERTTRVSLTYRDVLKVSKVASKIFGKPKT